MSIREVWIYVQSALKFALGIGPFPIIPIRSRERRVSFGQIRCYGKRLVSVCANFRRRLVDWYWGVITKYVFAKPT